MAGSGALAADLCAPLGITMDLATLEERPGVRLMRRDPPTQSLVISE